MESQTSKLKKTSILTGFSWAYAERIFTQASSIVVSIVLARLLSPEAYGTLALANIFIVLLKALVITGFDSALIQKKDASDTDFSSTLWFCLGVSSASYVLLFFFAPFIAALFSSGILAPIVRVLGIVLITEAMNRVFRAYTIREMCFRPLFISAVWCNLLSAALGIFLAYQGFGVWALVAQTLSRYVFDFVALAAISSFRPKPVFSVSCIRQIYRFGWKLIVSETFTALYDQLKSFFIGRKYTEEALAFYNKGALLPTALVANVNTPMSSVLMPALSRVQEDLTQVKQVTRRAVRTSATLLFPLLIGMLVCARPMVLLLLTETWAPCVPYMQLLCAALLMKPIQAVNLQAFLAIGRSDIYLKIQIAQKVTGAAIIILTVVCFSSPVAIAVGELVSYLMFTCVNILPNKHYLAYSFGEYLRDCIPPLLAAAIMGVAVYPVALLTLPLWLILLLQLLLGAVIYIGVSRIFRLDGFMFLWNLLLEYIKALRPHKS